MVRAFAFVSRPIVSRNGLTWTTRVVVLVLSLAASAASWAQARGQEYTAVGYREAGNQVLFAPTPEAVCTQWADMFGWRRNGFGALTIQERPGRWRCQRYFRGVAEPSQFATILGSCQSRNTVPLQTGKDWAYPQWDENKGVCYCAEVNKRFDATVQWCTANVGGFYQPDRDRPCPVGNPVNPASGVKEETETDYLSPDRILSLNRGYRFRTTFTAPIQPQVGAGWFLQIGLGLEPPLGSDTGPIKVRSPSGGVTRFDFAGGGIWRPAVASSDTVVEVLESGVRVGWRHFDRSENRLSTFGLDGSLRSVSTASGRSVTVTYSDEETPRELAAWAGVPVLLQSSLGRAIQLVSDTRGITQVVIPGAQINGSTGTAASPIRYAYGESASRGPGVGDLGQLTSVTYADGSSRRYHYEDERHPHALTGITDETGHRYSESAYDVDGRVTSQRWHDGLGASVNAFTFGYPVAGETTYVDALGLPRTHRSSHLDGVNLPVSDSQPAGSGCPASASQRSYDTAGNLLSSDDFDGRRSCFAYDSPLRREVVRVEGLAVNAACPALISSGVALPAGSRKVSTVWHPEWRLPVRRAEPGRITTWVYNGQPDPYNGNALAACAPAEARLPDGQPIAVVCRQVEQSTADQDGSTGFNASLQPGVAPRMQSWTYDVRGQRLTHKGPRTDVIDLWSYTYHPDTTLDHLAGDLRSVTNPIGHTTWFTRYDAHGQWIESLDPNGVTLTRTFDLRQRLTSSSVGGRVTSYLYDALGQLRRLTRPDGTFVDQTYDGARRLLAVQDSLGNRVQYTLDAAGNRTAERHYDPAGTLRGEVLRSYDALGRLQQSIGGEAP